jgi:hypothetical protein
MRRQDKNRLEKLAVEDKRFGGLGTTDLGVRRWHDNEYEHAVRAAGNKTKRPQPGVEITMAGTRRKKRWIIPAVAVSVGVIAFLLSRRARAIEVDGPNQVPPPPSPPDPLPPLPPNFRLAKHYTPGSPEAMILFTSAAHFAGLPKKWGISSALHNVLRRESDGFVGRVNHTYGARAKDPSQWPSVWAELQVGKITAKSSATGLGQLLLRNVDLYYPGGRAGIGNAFAEAVGMLRYIDATYGSPECAWYCYGGAHPGKRCASTGKRCHAHEGY